MSPYAFAPTSLALENTGMRPHLIRLCKILMLAAVASSFVGCANVSLVQRGTLAKPEMQFDIDPADIKVLDQVYVAREAAAGGRVTGGGGCGCTM